MKYGLAIILFLASFTAFGQLQKCGLPTFYPKNSADYHTFSDTCNWRTLRFKRGNDPKWFYQGDYIRNGLPADSFYTVNATLITVSYQDINCHIYNTATQSFWDWTGYSWANRKTFNLDSLLSANNTWLGKNTFKDSLTAEKGLKSGGIVDTKGLNTEGSNTMTAASFKGVQSDRDTIIASNYVINGSYGIVGFDCTTGQKEGQIFNDAQTLDWKFIIKKEDDSPNYLVLKNAQGIPFYTIKSRMTIIIKNKNGVWKRIQ